MRVLITFTISILLAASAAAATMYKYTDARGQVHYTDRPIAGAERVEIRSAQTFSRPTPTKASTTTDAAADPAAAEPKPEKVTSYSRVQVTSPAPEAVLVNTGGVIKVEVETEPELASGHVVRIFVDGEEKGAGTRTTVSEVFRGGHTVAAEVVDESGRVMMRSESVNFYVRQQSALFRRGN